MTNKADKYEFIIEEDASEEDEESPYSDKCHNVALGIVRKDRVKIIDNMGNYFLNCPEEIERIESDCAGLADGVYVYEVEFTRGDGWTIDDDVTFEPRSMKDDEWSRWIEGDKPWPEDWYESKPSSGHPVT